MRKSAFLDQNHRTASQFSYSIFQSLMDRNGIQALLAIQTQPDIFLTPLNVELICLANQLIKADITGTLPQPIGIL